MSLQWGITLPGAGPSAGEVSKKGIANALGKSKPDRHLDETVRRLIDDGLAEYTIPDKPNSRLQKDRLTEKGREILALIPLHGLPILIGPGTISASVIIGKRHDVIPACCVVLAAVLVATIIMVGLKALHDYVRPRREPLIHRYIEIAGRITALFVGTVSVDMIMRGIRAWAEKF